MCGEGTGEWKLCSVGNWGGFMCGGGTVYHWVQKFLCVRLLTGNTNSKIYSN